MNSNMNSNFEEKQQRGVDLENRFLENILRFTLLLFLSISEVQGLHHKTISKRHKAWTNVYTLTSSDQSRSGDILLLFESENFKYICCYPFLLLQSGWIWCLRRWIRNSMLFLSLKFLILLETVWFKIWVDVVVWIRSFLVMNYVLFVILEIFMFFMFMRFFCDFFVFDLENCERKRKLGFVRRVGRLSECTAIGPWTV